MKTYFTFFFSLFIVSFLKAQIPGLPGGSQEELIFPFERVYTSQPDDHYTLDLDTLPGGGFITLNAQRNIAKDSIKAINVINYDNKGTQTWTYQYEIERPLEFRIFGDIEALGDDSIAFVSILDTASHSRVITKIARDGTYGWSQRFNSEGVISNPNSYELLSLGEDRMVELVDVEDGGQTSILYTSYFNDGEVEFSKTLSSSAGLVVADAISTLDTTVVVLSTDGASFIITELDDSGNMIFSQKYESPLDNVVGMSALNITQIPSGNLAIAGIITEAGGSTQNVIIHLTDQGEIITAFAVSDLIRNISVRDVEARADSSLIIMGFNDLGNNEGEPFMAQMGLDSSLNFGWNSYSYISIPKATGFASTKDGGSIMYLNGGTSRQEERITPYLVRYDNRGGRNTLCSDQTLDLELSFVDIEASSIMISMEDAEVSSLDFSLMASPYQDFMPPVLSLQDTTYCPQDPINYLIDGSVQGGLGYLWEGEDFDFAPDPRMIIAKAPGMYSVTVSGRNQEQITCWTLCDTTNVNQREFPMVMIEPDFQSYCDNGGVTLAASSTNPIISLNWSTGSVDETRISVEGAGTYSVTITDDCGNTGQGSISLSDADLEFELPLETQIEDTYCTLGTVRVRLVGFNGDPSSLTWSNGTTGVSFIDVTEAGTYSVESDGFCKGVGQADISQSFFIEDGTVSINSVCGTNELVLTVAEENVSGREWSTGDTGVSTSVTTPGIYSVTATDLCGDPIEESIEITEDDLNECQVITGEQCMEYPNAFVPNSRREINQIFAPKNDCGPVTDYELRIYNRWGGEVFKSEAVEVGWNGFKGDTEAPADVYFFYSTYTVSGGATFEEKGDLLLIR